MKKIILLSILIVSALCVKAQCNLPYKSISDFKNDTSAFVMYNFMDRADCYAGKTFADVITDLQIPVKNFAYRNLEKMIGLNKLQYLLGIHNFQLTYSAVHT